MTKQILVSWIGTTDLLCMAHDGTAALKKRVLATVDRESTYEGRGPIGTLIDAIEFDELHLLCNYPNRVGRDFVKWLKRPVNLREVKLRAPTDYETVFKEANQFLEEVTSPGTQLSIHLSPGTPAMAAVWVLLGKSRFPATFYQTFAGKHYKTEIPFDLAVDYVPKLIRDSDRALSALADQSPRDIRGFDQVIGESKTMRAVVGRAAKAAVRDVSVLLQGESGTGKEVFSRAIHKASPRADGPFEAINCAAIPKELLESELFGHKKGAFTGADRDHVGALEKADEGTLFLDEIGECDPILQAKLLRAFQPPPGEGPCHRVYRRVGDSKDRTANVRIIAATNRDLMQRIEQHLFREDLYYRLAVITVKLPPLRERSTDIPLLADYLLDEINSQFRGQEPGYTYKKLGKDAISFMRNYPWPGNVRQLGNALTQAAVMTDRDVIKKVDLAAAVEDSRPIQQDPLEVPLGDGFDLAKHLEAIQRELIERALEESGGVKSKARRLLGIPSDQNLAAKMKKLGIDT